MSHSTLLKLTALIVAAAAASAAPGPALLSSGRAPLDDVWPPERAIRLCAIRVEFIPDDVGGTTGDGTMGSGFDSTLVIDPLPHDKVYFEDHLRFLKNYYHTASRGHLTFDTLAVYPESDTAVYRLDFPMWHYNYNTDDELLNRKLVDLFVESVAEAASDVDFSRYDAILVFHAGVGKDFNLGWDNTPFDIPSAYISESDVASYHGSAHVPNGVTRGLILPEGENQKEALDLEVELSLNGIMVKLFGNWLGLPDLFNTETGQSGVGRWAMMDQGSGNMNALVPALPDAWSRIYMGWEEAATIGPSSVGDTVRIARFSASGAPAVAKLPITPREYYLIENRDSDADSIGYVELRDRAGRRLQMNSDGDIALDSGFAVAVSASHYDFGIPGSGLLIWHIDEDVIQRDLSANRVNADPHHRGVDLVEADGPQDIGQLYGFASSGSGAELGIPEDAWYRNNDAHRAANGDALTVRFADRTFPSARLYDGSFTRIELSSFSDVAEVMSFVATSSDVLPGYPVTFTSPAQWAVADLNGDAQRELYFLSDHALCTVDSLGNRTTVRPMVPGEIQYFSPVSAQDLDADGRDELLLGGLVVAKFELDDTEYRLQIYGPPQSTPAFVYPAKTVQDTGCILAVAQTTSPGGQRVLQASVYDLNSLMGHSTTIVAVNSPMNPMPFNLEPFPASRFVFASQGFVRCMRIEDLYLVDAWPPIADSRIQPDVVVVSEPNDSTAIYIEGYGYVWAHDGSVACLEPDCIPPDVDWDQDGIPDGGGRFGRNETARENAPHLSADVAQVVDLDASGDADVLGWSVSQTLADSVTAYARLTAASHNGSTFDGFPLAVTIAEPRFFELEPNGELYVMGVAFDGRDWHYSPKRLVTTRGAARHTYLSDNALINVGPLNLQVHARADWLYCWPNPTSDVSRIRVTLSYPARVEARIFDLAGRLVARLEDQSTLPGPFEVNWDVSRVESGVYIARVKAVGGGHTEESQLKIAVVK